MMCWTHWLSRSRRPWRLFANAMRVQVELEASQIFKQLSTEETYSGLRIDGRYYLEIVDSNDRVIRRRSAGADQIVTMSLIGALVRCAVRQGPVVMDTPFGRLDRGPPGADPSMGSNSGHPGHHVRSEWRVRSR